MICLVSRQPHTLYEMQATDLMRRLARTDSCGLGYSWLHASSDVVGMIMGSDLGPA